MKYDKLSHSSGTDMQIYSIFCISSDVSDGCSTFVIEYIVLNNRAQCIKVANSPFLHKSCLPNMEFSS